MPSKTIAISCITAGLFMLLACRTAAGEKAYTEQQCLDMGCLRGCVHQINGHPDAAPACPSGTTKQNNGGSCYYGRPGGTLSTCNTCKNDSTGALGCMVQGSFDAR
jgi:hypothetical protein